MESMKSVVKVRLKQVKDGRIRFAVDRVSEPRDVYEAVRRYYRGADREILSVLCLDSQNQPTCFSVASISNAESSSSGEPMRGT